MPQWLRLHAPNAGGLGSIPVLGTRAHMLQLLIKRSCMSQWRSKIATKTWCSQINKNKFKNIYTYTCILKYIDCSPPGSSVHGISQARILEQVAISYSRGSSRPRDQTHISCIAGGFFITGPPGKPLVFKYDPPNWCQNGAERWISLKLQIWGKINVIISSHPWLEVICYTALVTEIGSVPDQ